MTNLGLEVYHISDPQPTSTTTKIWVPHVLSAALRAASLKAFLHREAWELILQLLPRHSRSFQANPAHSRAVEPGLFAHQLSPAEMKAWEGLDWS